MDEFTPSIDWSRALADSLRWVAEAWLVSAIGAVAVLALFRMLTPWGRQFWRISGRYFSGAASVRVWLMLGVLLLSVIIGVRLNVLFSYRLNDLSTSLQTAFQGAAAHKPAVRSSGVQGFWFSIEVFIVLAVMHVARVMADIYITQRFIIAWRVWLTDHLTGDWLDSRAYYHGHFIDGTIDNPDQRIQQDIDIFTAGVGGGSNAPANGTTTTLLFGGVESVASVISFAAILWNLSGTLTVLGVNVPRAMFWTVILYVLVASVIAFRIGRPLVWLSFRNEMLNAAFRYALVRLRDAAEAVGFYRGERAERAGLRRRFDPIIENYRRFVRRTVGLMGWNFSVSQAIGPLPWVIQAPRLFAGVIKFGDVTQTATAFAKIHDSLSFFRNSYEAFACYRAAIIRLDGLVDADSRARRLPVLNTAATIDGSVKLDDVEVRTPSGTQLVNSLDLRLDSGDTLVITGPSGSGKTTLLRSLAELWPFASGTLNRPDGANETMFLSQMPYVPLGDLRAVVSYPAAAGDIGDAVLRDVLVKVALGHLVCRLDQVEDWARVLSLGEQQRVAFARILFTKPRAVFLDEATAALDEGLEFALYQLLRSELPDCIVVSVSHRHTVEQHHEHLLELLGDGDWRLSRMEERACSRLLSA
jgi:vitamin B12/bleomycin/antimicrobial peptide transport system ATP-binding/permease protein